ncbi:MAG: HAMP domain-containing sensor histidine kinase [Phycisphaeraceae bacterium]
MSDPDPTREPGFPGLGHRPDTDQGAQALSLLDQTERQLLELEDAASPWLQPEGLGLAAVLAHEISNLLTPVSLYAARARRKPNDPELALQAAEHAEKALDQVNRLTETVLSLSHCVHQHEASTASAPALDATREALDELSLWSANIRFDLSGLPPELTLPIEPAALQRVLVNIAGNALKAIQRTGVGTTIHFTASSNSTQTWLIIEDDGPGIDPETATTLFDPWSQSAGHGIGLTLCRQLVERRNGSLTYRPTTPHGCRFTLTF